LRKAVEQFKLGRDVKGKETKAGEQDLTADLEEKLKVGQD